MWEYPGGIDAWAAHMRQTRKGRQAEAKTQHNHGAEFGAMTCDPCNPCNPD